MCVCVCVYVCVCVCSVLACVRLGFAGLPPTQHCSQTPILAAVNQCAEFKILTKAMAPFIRLRLHNQCVYFVLKNRISYVAPFMQLPLSYRCIT